MHEAHCALDAARAATVLAARSIVTRGKKETLGVKPSTAASKALAERPRKPSGLALLFNPVRWARSSRVLLAGAASGAVTKTATAPLETLRIKLMAHGGSIQGTVVSTYQAGGLQAFFKGNAVNVVRTVPSKAIQFWSFDAYKRMLRRPNPTTGQLELPAWGSSVAGSLSGVTSTILTHPLETLQTRLAAGSYTNVGQAMVSIVRAEGPKALFGGLMPSLVGIIPYSGLNLGCYDALRSGYTKWSGSEHVPKVAAFVMGAVSGATAATATYPLEVVRRRMMMNSAKYANMGVALATIAKEEGVPALFAGVGLNWAKVVPAGGLQIYSYELFKEWLQLEQAK